MTMTQERLTGRMLVEEGWVQDEGRWFPPIDYRPSLSDIGKPHLLDEGVPAEEVRQLREDCRRIDTQAREMTRAGWFRRDGSWHMPGSWGKVRKKGTHLASNDGIGFEEAYRLFSGLRGYFPGEG